MNKMKIPDYIDERIDEMQESEKKRAWEQLKETDNVYVQIPSIDTLNYRYKNINSLLRMKTLPALEYLSEYYRHVNDIYQNYDFILNKDFFESLVHPNEYDSIYMTDKTRNHANMICEKIDERIRKLENMIK